MRILRHAAARLVGRARVGGRYIYWPYHYGKRGE